MRADWTEWNGHMVRVKPEWQLTSEITDFVVDCLCGLAASFAAENEWDLVAETMEDLGHVWFGPVERRKETIEHLLWAWSTDLPGEFKRYPAVKQVIDIRELPGRRVN